MPFTDDYMVLRYFKKMTGSFGTQHMLGGRFEGCPEEGVALAVIGDVHGYLDQFRDLVTQIHVLFDRLGAEKRIIVQVGDLIDRGADSRGCLDFARELQSDEHTGYVQLMGNHEIMLRMCLRSVDDCRESAPDWLMFGGRETINSLAGEEICPSIPDVRNDPEAFHAMLRQVTGRPRAEFVATMQPAFLSGSLLVSHAGLPSQAALQEALGESWDQYSPGHWAWNRSPSDRGIAYDTGTLFQVHGHSIHPKAGPVKGRFAVDSGVYTSGVLSGAVFMDGRYEVLTSRSDRQG